MQIKTALISVYHKEGLEQLLGSLAEHDVQFLSTGGTQRYIESLGYAVTPVEELTGYPSILDGRVKTLHPAVFGGLLARRQEPHHEQQMQEHSIAPIDMVVVDLYPFQDTVAHTDVHQDIIEKIDIGGISLLRAAAKNYNDVLVVSSRDQYGRVADMIRQTENQPTQQDRLQLATEAFAVTSQVDAAILEYMQGLQPQPPSALRIAEDEALPLRYGENPHQKAQYFGPLSEMMHKIQGKALSYNNLVDIDAAVRLISEFWDHSPTVAVLKHTNACGVATRDTAIEAWDAALAGDPISAFGGIFVFNTRVDLASAKSINKLFYEVLIAPSFDQDALEELQTKKKRILLQLVDPTVPISLHKQILNGTIVQDYDDKVETQEDLKVVTKQSPSEKEIEDLLFANKCVKHLKSNAIALVKDHQLVAMGCGQTSRVDALQQAIHKAKRLGFELQGAVMASDAFFPFPDCVEIANQAGISSVIQPGGSIKDQDSVDYCDGHRMSMVFTGYRHFKH